MTYDTAHPAVGSNVHYIPAGPPHDDWDQPHDRACMAATIIRKHDGAEADLQVFDERGLQYRPGVSRLPAQQGTFQVSESWHTIGELR